MASSANTQGELAAYKDEEEAQLYSYAMQLVSSGSLPMALHTAFQLDIFEIIAKEGPGAQVTPSQIVAHLSSENPNAVSMLDRMLRLLASHSILTCSVVDQVGFTRAYGLAPVAAKYFVGNPDIDGASLGPLMKLTQHKLFSDSWYELGGAIVEGGIPFNRAHGIHIFEYQDPKFNEVFNQAMINNTSIVINRILDSYNGFHPLKSLVDVGGGLGITISKITAKYPAIKGINLDLPRVVQHAPAYAGVQHIGGDMFVSVPQADAILLKFVLHDWDDVHCVKLLKKCYTCLPDDGKVIVIEAVLPVLPNSSSTVKQNCQVDLIMMMNSTGGKERSEHEFLALAIAAGFRGINNKCFVCDLWVMEFYK